MATGQPGADFSHQPAAQNQNQQVGPSVISEEERRILKECERESFYKRALPLSCGAMLGIQYLIRSGKMAGHPKFGALPKTIIASGLAYLMGKVSYLPECRKKILEKIPDSSLAATIRKGQQRPAFEGRPQQDPFMNQNKEQQPADDNSSYRNTLPANTPSYEGLNDSQRPSMDNEVRVQETPAEKKSTTYEDLRRRNRQEHNDSLSPPGQPGQPGSPSYKDSPYMPQKAWPDKKSPSAPPQEGQEADPYQAPPKRKRTNMWGDVIDD